MSSTASANVGRPNLRRDASTSAIMAGFIAVAISYAGPLLVTLEAAVAADLSPQLTASMGVGDLRRLRCGVPDLLLDHPPTGHGGLVHSRRRPADHPTGAVPVLGCHRGLHRLRRGVGDPGRDRLAGEAARRGPQAHHGRRAGRGALPVCHQGRDRRGGHPHRGQVAWFWAIWWAAAGILAMRSWSPWRSADSSL